MSKIQLDLKITQIEGFDESHLWMMVKIVDIMKRYKKTKFKIQTLMNWTKWGRSKVIKVGQELRTMRLLTVENTTKAYGGQGSNLYKITTGFISYLENMEGETFDLSDEITVSEKQPALESEEDDLPLDVVGNGGLKSTTAVSEKQPPIKPINFPISLKGEPPQNFDKFSPTQKSKEEIEAKLDELVQTLGIENSEHKAYSITQTIRNQIPTKEISDYVDYIKQVEAKRPDFHSRKTKNGELVKFIEIAYSRWFYSSFQSWKLEARQTPTASPEDLHQRQKEETRKFVEQYDQKPTASSEDREKAKAENARMIEEVRQKLKKEVFGKPKNYDDPDATPPAPIDGWTDKFTKKPDVQGEANETNWRTKLSSRFTPDYSESVDMEARRNQILNQFQS